MAHGAAVRHEALVRRQLRRAQLRERRGRVRVPRGLLEFQDHFNFGFTAEEFYESVSTKVYRCVLQ